MLSFIIGVVVGVFCTVYHEQNLDLLIKLFNKITKKNIKGPNLKSY